MNYWSKYLELSEVSYETKNPSIKRIFTVVEIGFRNRTDVPSMLSNSLMINHQAKDPKARLNELHKFILDHGFIRGHNVFLSRAVIFVGCQKSGCKIKSNSARRGASFILQPQSSRREIVNKNKTIPILAPMLGVGNQVNAFKVIDRIRFSLGASLSEIRLRESIELVIIPSHKKLISQITGTAMRFFWKALLIVIPVGGYWLYKKSSSPPADTEMKSEQTQETKVTSESPPGRDAAAKQGGVAPDEQIIEHLTELDGVTSRVAENLVEKGIHTKEDLKKLSRDELMEIKGIGPKRAEKILNSK